MKVDVLVVGAGPAGSSTAIHLARGGARVLLADKARFPRDKPCGGGLTGRALKRIPADPSPVVERDVDRFELRLRYGSSFARSHDEPLIRMTQRRHLDAFLAEQAVGAGADFRDGARVEVTALDSDGVRTSSHERPGSGTGSSVGSRWRETFRSTLLGATTSARR